MRLMNILYFDTETTGLPRQSDPLDHPEQPHITQLGFILEVNGHDAMVVDTLIKPQNWPFRKDKSVTLPNTSSIRSPRTHRHHRGDVREGRNPDRRCGRDVRDRGRER
jgi:hypothetical protein